MSFRVAEAVHRGLDQGLLQAVRHCGIGYDFWSVFRQASDGRVNRTSFACATGLGSAISPRRVAVRSWSASAAPAATRSSMGSPMATTYGEPGAVRRQNSCDGAYRAIRPAGSEIPFKRVPVAKTE